MGCAYLPKQEDVVVASFGRWPILKGNALINTVIVEQSITSSSGGTVMLQRGETVPNDYAVP